MKIRPASILILAATVAAVALLMARTFATSMALVFTALAIIVGTIARDAFGPHDPVDRR